MVITKIISGGQTGADRAGLEVAMAQNISHGGWCPKGRKALDGALDPQIPTEGDAKLSIPTAERVECP